MALSPNSSTISKENNNLVKTKMTQEKSDKWVYFITKLSNAT